ncbi:membrane-associated protein, putative [Bodo saltans]|uniref:Membrane-associated protein, putative n=1 Tax=Bodo saltans TaxID=75058 RepID=A0A0S4JN41_BODSA|nr:membrane-associated protein, putative [Bodo saltans]|eukprot:CUG91831.1 membrane-associated protein, putative [Bodo saltans]
MTRLHQISQMIMAAVIVTMMLLLRSTDAACSMGAQANCTAAAYRAGIVAQGCITTNRLGDGPGCADDVCASQVTGASCVVAAQCSPVPIGTFRCASSQLLCWSYNQTQCALRSYCSWTTTSSPYCNYTVPLIAPAVAQAAALSDTCPAIHPAVLAILIIMFVTLLIAIGIVLGVVVLNKKKQDELEREEEEAEAEEAIGRL